MQKEDHPKGWGFAYATDYATQLSSFKFAPTLSTKEALRLWIFYQQLGQEKVQFSTIEG